MAYCLICGSVLVLYIPIQCHPLTCVSGWNRIPCIWACSHHALGRATQQIQDGDDGQPAGAASARSVEGVRRGQSDIWPYPMARSASPAASAHVGKPLDPSSRAQADSGCWGGFAWAGPVRRCRMTAVAAEAAVVVDNGRETSGETSLWHGAAAGAAARVDPLLRRIRGLTRFDRVSCGRWLVATASFPPPIFLSLH